MECEAKWRAVFLFSFVWAGSAIVFACRSDDRPVSRGAGGGAGTGGAAGAGGKGAGGTTGTAGTESGGVVGSGGKGTGGSGGMTALPDGGTDAHRPECTATKVLVYEAPGCDGVSTPVCALPDLDACLIEVCGCDGTTLSGCGDYARPYRHRGACQDAAIRDSGSDAH